MTSERHIYKRPPMTLMPKERVIWRKLHCLQPNLQKMQRYIHRKDA
jgi:hypothetical protein